MKKLLFTLVLALLCLTSCSAGAKEILYYQESGAKVSGTLFSDTGTFYITLTLFPSAKDEYTVSVRDAVIEYSAPDELSGYRAAVEGGGVTLSSGGLSLPCSDKAGERCYDIIKLFSIDESTLYSVENGDDGTVTLSFGENEPKNVVIDSESSLPVRIYRSDGELDFKIDEYLPTENVPLDSGESVG